jgi:hypothetical protein
MKRGRELWERGVLVIASSAFGCAGMPSAPDSGMGASDGSAGVDAAGHGGDGSGGADSAAFDGVGGSTDGGAEGDSAIVGGDGGSTDGSAESGSMNGSDSGAGALDSPFVCNLIIGNSTTQQWFDGGFLVYPGIVPTRWELFWVAHHYIDMWANPEDTAWSTPLDMGHACSTDATTPDRVIFIVTYAPPYPTEATYQTDLTSIANDILAKYAGVKKIELMTLIRAPDNSSSACSSAANNEQAIPPQEDEAIAMVAADPTFDGLVFADPPLYVPLCSDFIANAPQYTDAGATDIAQVYGAHYAAHP